MKTTKLEAEAGQTLTCFGRSLTGDVVEAPTPADQPHAVLKVSVYPWGVEFEVVPDGEGHEGEE